MRYSGIPPPTFDNATRAEILATPEFLVRKYLKAYVLEEGYLKSTNVETHQDDIISPLLGNIFLHNVLDELDGTQLGM
jgi:retron-type reverse transcriptase